MDADKDKENVIYMVEYDSALKKKEILPLVITWMNLEDIILSKIIQTQIKISHNLTYMWNKEKENLNSL